MLQIVAPPETTTCEATTDTGNSNKTTFERKGEEVTQTLAWDKRGTSMEDHVARHLYTNHLIDRDKRLWWRRSH
jgi:hypothetical protein